MKITKYFEILKTKEIICRGSGKHFRNITYPFLCKSGLIENLKGFMGTSGEERVEIFGRTYDVLSRDEVAAMDRERTLILVAVTGYAEILSQFRSDENLSCFDAVPSIYLESLYEDLLLLSVPKPPLHYHQNDKPVIPKTIHAIWFSGEPMPELYQRCLASWKRYAPDFAVKIWDLKTYRPGPCLFFEQAIKCGNWAFASDYARADLLYRYGGIYMDLDVEMLRPIDDLLYNDAYMSFESLDRIECGSGMGAVAGHPVLKEICESYENRPYLRADGTWDTSTCPVRYTKVIEKHGLQKDGSFQHVAGITVYPFEVLTGKSYDTGIIYQTEQSYTLHHHHGSWVPGKALRAMQERYANIQKFLVYAGIESPGITLR